MMGMGSRGDSPTSVLALTTFVELLELAKAADLPVRIAELRQAETAARAAWAEVDQKTADHDARQKDLDNRADALEAREKQTAARETACASREEATTRQQTTFDEQRAALAAQKREMDDRATLFRADLAAFDAAKLLQAGEHQAKAKALAEESNRQYRVNEAAIKARNEKADADIAAKHAAADAVIAAAQAELTRREARIIGREEAFERERSRFTALLRE